MTAAPYLVLRRRRISGSGAVSFNPASLFAGGENGVWYEPSATTAFRSTTDLTPCAVGESCGFLLDKSQGAGYSGGAFTGLGSELLASGSIGIVGSATPATYNTSTGVGTASRSALPDQSFVSIPVTAGSQYLLDIQNDGATVLAIRDQALSMAYAADVGSGRIFAVVQPTDAELRICAASNGTSVSFTVNSIAELPGFHATQGTAAARPLLQQTAGGLYYLEFDTVDDWIGVTASVLGAGMTAYTMLVAFELRSESSVDGVAGFTNGGYSAGDSLVVLRNRSSTGIEFDTGFPYATNNFTPAAQASSISTPYLALITSTNGAQSARLNGSEYATGTVAHAASTPAEFTLGAYSRAGATAGEVNIYGALLINRVLTAEEIANLEAHAAALSGVTL